jgi:uracil-DNA glycosylase
MPKPTMDTLLSEVRACTLCEKELKDGVRPILQAHSQSRILIAGQAPGAKVHASGIPFDDASGDRLRQWMGVDQGTFYDATQIAILPMAFCYPGKGKSGDLPPPPLCAETWRKRLLDALPAIQLTLVIGQYAQAWHLPHQSATLTETVKNWKAYSNDIIPLPHPSPRNNIWLSKNRWFETQLLPVIRQRVKQALATTD